MELKFEYNSDILKFRVQYNHISCKKNVIILQQLFPYFVDTFVSYHNDKKIQFLCYITNICSRYKYTMF